MNEKDFKELLESVAEVGLVEAGGSKPNREVVVEKSLDADAASVESFAICLAKPDEDLIPLKIYHVLLQPRHKTCTVKDENGETTVCPIEWFLPVEFPKNVEQVLEEAELALA